MNTIVPPVFWFCICLAAACAQRKEPVVLMSMTFLHWSAVISMAWMQPTIPAKQRRISSEPMEAAAEEKAEETRVASVTSTGAVEMVEEGKSVRKDSMA